MVGITTISTPPVACSISGFESHWTFLGTSQTMLEWIYNTSKGYPRSVEACVFGVSQFQWTKLHGTLWEHAIQVCAISYPYFKYEKEHVICLWLFVEDEFVQSVLNVVH
jgi:hypothetical protein